MQRASVFTLLSTSFLLSVDAAAQDPQGPPAPPACAYATQGASLPTGACFTDCEPSLNLNCPEMVIIPSGTFQMGDPFEPFGQPLHQVTITHRFAVGRYAVTFDQWQSCLDDIGAGDGNHCTQPINDKGWGRGMRPVIAVDPLQVKAYVQWLSKKTGKPYRLLSEAEREYVTRAGTSTPFWMGSSISKNQANYNGYPHI